MIRSLTLENFRRHAKTEIEFGADAQIIAISGRNGMGKTTLLEAILMALYGETRHGRRGIAGVVRRGAEHEGMTVECEFTVAGVLYKVVRRYEKGKHSAALYANNTLHTQTADGVTAAITALLGMDSTGFRLATIAKQKELDGLAEMTPSVRRKTIARLLRLDAVQAAQLVARDKHNTAKTSANALTGAANIAERQDDLNKALETLGEVQAAHAEAVAAVAALDAQIGSGSDVEDQFRAAQLAAGRAEAARDAVAAELSRAQNALAVHRVPDAVAAPERPLSDITVSLAQVNDLIARGNAQQALANQLASSTRRISETRTRLDELLAARTELEKRAPVDGADARIGAVSTAEKQVSFLRSRRDSLLADTARLNAEAAALRKKLTNLDAVGATCDACGQDVAAEHRHSAESDWKEQLAQLTSQIQSVRNDAEELDAQTEAAAAALAAAQRDLRDFEAARTESNALTERIGEGERALAVYEADVARLSSQVEEIDLEGAYATKTRLEAAKVEAENAEHAALVREAALTKAAELNSAVLDATGRLAAAEEAVALAVPDPDLVASFERRQKLVADRAAEREFCDALAIDLAGARAKVEAAEEALASTQQVSAQIDAYRTEAEVAAKTARLLEGVAKKLATQIRPQLEGQVSALLQQMSEGRFSAASVSDDYEVTVCDHDGKFYPVSEYSGGEADLIALAIRLALAQVVAARHGAGGAGFLILDEVFGSQDEGRRFAILEALRRLRGTYGQILLISHVGGIEDVADMVLDVGRDEDEEVAQVAVLAG